MDDLVSEGVASFKLFMAYPGVLMVDDATIFKALGQTAKNGALICMHAENGGVIDTIVQRTLAEGKTAPIYHALTRPTRPKPKPFIAPSPWPRWPARPSTSFISRRKTRSTGSRGPRPRTARLRRNLSRNTCCSRSKNSNGPISKAPNTSSRPRCAKSKPPKLWDGLRTITCRLSPPTTARSASPIRSTSAKTISPRSQRRPGRREPSATHPSSRRECQASISLNRFVELVSTTPARLFGMYPRKGALAVGSDADIVIWDPNAEHTISAATHHMRVDYSMFEGFQVKGNAKVISRGEVIVENGKFTAAPAAANISRRSPGRRMELTATLTSQTVDPQPLSTTKTSRPSRSLAATWGTYNYAALWVAMSVCIPTYMLASGLIAGGMSWWQAIGTILLGNLIVLVPMLLNAHAGAKYGIPFPSSSAPPSASKAPTSPPSSARSSPAAGSASRPGSAAAIFSMLKILWPRGNFPAASGSASSPSGSSTWPSSGAASKPSNSSKASARLHALRRPAAPLVDHRQSRRPRPRLSAPSKFKTTAAFLKFFIPSLTGMVGFWATVALNIPDFTRYAKSQRAQMRSARRSACPRHDPVLLHRRRRHLRLGRVSSAKPSGIRSRSSAASSARRRLHRAGRLAHRHLNTNVAANVVSPSNDFSNLNPRLISFRTGGMITGVVGILMMPWKLLGDFSAYIFGWLVGYSGLLGPIAGVMIADYFIVRGENLQVDDLYRRGGIYEYSNGFNYRAIVALVCGVAIALIGLAVPGLRWLYDYAWFVGFFMAGAVYVILMRGSK
jgi:NCS1 family nucleobase:cation symporter-1